MQYMSGHDARQLIDLLGRFLHVVQRRCLTSHIEDERDVRTDDILVVRSQLSYIPHHYDACLFDSGNLLRKISC